MNDELRATRKFAERQQIFDPRYMVGSKLGDCDSAPGSNALIVMELSDKQAAWADEAKDEVIKLLNNVINVQCETLNVALFSSGGVTTWCPQFQSRYDAKKGLPDAIKWINKSFSAKTCAGQSWPPDWTALFSKYLADDAVTPQRIYLTCTRPPSVGKADVLNLLSTFRDGDPDAGIRPKFLPLNIVAFDHDLDGEPEEKAWFEQMIGPESTFMIDSSASDLVAMDKMLKSVQLKKKQLEKLNKKLEKLEDFSERVISDRQLLQMQLALQRLLESDYEMLDWSLKTEILAPAIEI